VALPRQALGRLFHRTVAARWRGEPVSVRGPVRDGHVFVDFHGTPERARELEAQGDAERGWYLRVPASELSDLHDEDTP
ncbi:MAG: hypothetical protein H0X12_15515, partial [Nocardioides sp.]|nr:hypothetical protein [Nocardioides sp.]